MDFDYTDTLRQSQEGFSLGRNDNHTNTLIDEHQPDLKMQSIIPSLNVGLETEEGSLHNCCVRRRNSEVLRTLLGAAEPLDRDDQKKVVKAIADEQVPFPSLLPSRSLLFDYHMITLLIWLSSSLRFNLHHFRLC